MTIKKCNPLQEDFVDMKITTRSIDSSGIFFIPWTQSAQIILLIFLFISSVIYFNTHFYYKKNFLCVKLSKFLH